MRKIYFLPLILLPLALGGCPAAVVGPVVGGLVLTEPLWEPVIESTAKGVVEGLDVTKAPLPGK